MKVDKTINKICENPEIGKPLRYYNNVRAEKIGVFRLVYLFKKDKVIFLVLGHRKHVYENLDEYLD